MGFPRSPTLVTYRAILYICGTIHIVLENNLVVLGGGWAGLLVAKKLSDAGVKSISILEASKEGEQGGLLKSEMINGFTFDCGGPHLLFSRDKEILSYITDLLHQNYYLGVRKNFVFYKNQYIPYPFENGVYQLPPEDRVKFIKGIMERMIFIAKNDDWKPKNFLDWILGFFGENMAEEYLIPYNKKIWKRPLDMIAADWVFSPGRLPFPELENMLMTVAGISNVGYKEQANFYYPSIGGIEALFQSLYNKIRIAGVQTIGGEKVDTVRLTNSNVFNINGRILARKLISTIPIPELLLAINEDDYKDLAERFDYNSVVVVGVAIKGRTPDQTAIYVPDHKIIFHRYTWMSYLTPPKDRSLSNLIAEVTIPKGEKYNMEQITEKVVRGLLDMCVIKDESDVLFTKAWLNKYGYPIYSLDHNKIREDALRMLDNYGIKTVGRWGSWHYWNTDMVVKAVNLISTSNNY